MNFKYIKKELNKRTLLLNDYSDEKDFYDTETEEIRAHYRNNLQDFFINFWKDAGTANDLVPDISLDCLTEHLKALMAGEFKTLLFVMPPRQGKSTFLSVMFPAYLWIHDPRIRLLTTCYAPDYAFRDNKNMQELIQSAQYQYLWGKDFRLTRTSRERTNNSLGGIRVATAIGGKNVGEGGVYNILDDVNNVNDVYSQTKLQKTNNIINNIFVTRQNNPADTKVIMGQHRCSHIDAIGSYLSKNDGSTAYVNLAMEHEIKRRTVTVSKKIPGKIIWEDKRKEGELLSPTRYTADSLTYLKRHMGTALYSALYQGLPVMDEAAIFKEEWFKFWPHGFLPEFDTIIQSWDTAISTDANACFSACSTYGVFKTHASSQPNLMLLSMWSGKKEWHELYKMMQRLANNYEDVSYNNPLNYSNKPDVILVEAKANGLSLIQQLSRVGIQCVKYNPPKTNDRRVGNYEDAKTVRARLVSPIVESGKVWVPTKAPDHDTPQKFAEHFIRACTIFPSNANDTRDIVDTFSQAVDWLKQKRILYDVKDLITQSLEKPTRHVVYS